MANWNIPLWVSNSTSYGANKGVVYERVSQLGSVLTNDQLPISPYLNRRLRSIEEAEEDARRLRDRRRDLTPEPETPRPSAQVIQFPQH